MTTPGFKVLITTSGIGSRLGALTEHTNKSLVPVGGKPSLAHIIEAYPISTEFVITLGHFGNHVRQFIEIAFADRQIEFVEIGRFMGPGSSLAQSMFEAKDLLLQPFVYHASDAIVLNQEIPFPHINWVGGFKGRDAASYSTFDASGDSVVRLHNKGMVDFDYIHTGIIGVHDYSAFWNCLEVALKESDDQENPNDVSAIRKMIANGLSFSVVDFNSWIDVGNSYALNAAEENLGNPFPVLRKTDESISFISNKVVKFFSDNNKCNSRILRSEVLSGLVPKIIDTKPNFFSYNFVKGQTISQHLNPSIINSLLTWANSNLWTADDREDEEMLRVACKEFYAQKTFNRVSEFLNSRGVADIPNMINGTTVPSVRELLQEAIPFLFVDPRKARIHGDFILDNIIYDGTSFTLIDWRESFGRLTLNGDIYYDLAKLNHSLVINHEIVERGLFEIEIVGNEIELSILIKDTLKYMSDELKSWATINGYDYHKIKILTGLIWLNMSALHHHPFDIFLFYYGKYNLWRALNAKT